MSSAPADSLRLQRLDCRLNNRVRKLVIGLIALTVLFVISTVWLLLLSVALNFVARPNM